MKEKILWRNNRLLTSQEKLSIIDCIVAEGNSLLYIKMWFENNDCSLILYCISIFVENDRGLRWTFCRPPSKIFHQLYFLNRTIVTTQPKRILSDFMSQFQRKNTILELPLLIQVCLHRINCLILQQYFLLDFQNDNYKSAKKKKYTKSLHELIASWTLH